MEEEAALSRAQIEMTIRDRRDEGKFIIGLLACHTFFTVFRSFSFIIPTFAFFAAILSLPCNPE